MKLNKKLDYWKLQLSNYLTGEYYTSESYKDIKKNIKLLEKDLRQLRRFELNVMNGDVNGYGVLES